MPSYLPRHISQKKKILGHEHASLNFYKMLFRMLVILCVFLSWVCMCIYPGHTWHIEPFKFCQVISIKYDLISQFCALKDKNSRFLHMPVVNTSFCFVNGPIFPLVSFNQITIFCRNFYVILITKLQLQLVLELLHLGLTSTRSWRLHCLSVAGKQVTTNTAAESTACSLPHFFCGTASPLLHCPSQATIRRSPRMQAPVENQRRI